MLRRFISLVRTTRRHTLAALLECGVSFDEALRMSKLNINLGGKV